MKKKKKITGEELTLHVCLKVARPFKLIKIL